MTAPQQRDAAAKAKLETAAATINALKPLAAELARIEADLDGIADADHAAIKAMPKMRTPD